MSFFFFLKGNENGFIFKRCCSFTILCKWCSKIDKLKRVNLNGMWIIKNSKDKDSGFSFEFNPAFWEMELPSMKQNLFPSLFLRWVKISFCIVYMNRYAALLLYAHHQSLKSLWRIEGSSRTFLLGVVVDECQLLLLLAIAWMTIALETGSVIIFDLQTTSKFFKVSMKRGVSGIGLKLHMTIFSPGRLFFLFAFWVEIHWSHFKVCLN